jgi:sulfur-oxidizing protein SoxZ
MRCFLRREGTFQNYLYIYTSMSGIVRILAREENGIVQVKIIIPHPNESGTRKDEQGVVIPAHFVREGSVRVNGAALLDIELGPSVSTDPFLQFRFPGKKGDVLNVTFLDNRNELFTAEAIVQ